MLLAESSLDDLFRASLTQASERRAAKEIVMRFARSAAILTIALFTASAAFIALPASARADHDNIAERCGPSGCNVIHCNRTGDRCVRLDRRDRHRGYGYDEGPYGYRPDRYRDAYDGDRRDHDRRRDFDGGYRNSDYSYKDGYVYRDRSQRESKCGYDPRLCGQYHDRGRYERDQRQYGDY
jgi:hypothetical protein